MLSSTALLRALHALRTYNLQPIIRRAVVKQWHKQPGDLIQQNDAVVTICDRMTNRCLDLKHKDAAAFYMAKQIFAEGEDVSVDQALGVIADSKEEVKDARDWDPRNDFISSPIELDSVWGAEVGARNSRTLADQLAEQHNKAQSAEKKAVAGARGLKYDEKKEEGVAASGFSWFSPYQQKDHVFPSEAAMDKAVRNDSDVERHLHWGGTQAIGSTEGHTEEELDDVDAHLHGNGYQFTLQQDMKAEKKYEQQYEQHKQEAKKQQQQSKHDDKEKKSHKKHSRK